FILISSMRALSLTIGGSFIAVGLADFIVHKVDLYDIPFINQLIQLAAILLASVLLMAGIRSHNKRSEMRQQAETLLAQQQELDSSRNLLIRNSLETLKAPLAQLKTKLQAQAPANPKAVQPAL